MIDPSPGLPPHIALLLNEEFDFSDGRGVLRKLKGMVREMKDQTEAGSIHDPIEPDKSTDEFRAVLSGGLDVFSSDGACQQLPCRISYAEQISRSIALLSDRVTVHDYFYERILDLRSRPTHAEISHLATDLVVLKSMKPLIQAGILRFTLPFLPTCRSCIGEFEARVNELTEKTFEGIRNEILVEREDGKTVVGLGPIYDPPIVNYVDPEYASGKTDDDLRRYVIRRAVRSTLWDARSAGWISGSVFSNSPTAISALLCSDGLEVPTSGFRAFAAERAATLPWVSGLSINQTLELRDAASSALPQLREFLARRLVHTPGSTPDQSWRDTVAELREQAAQTKSELEAATSASPSLRKNATCVLGLAVSAVCLATEGPGSALTGLLGTLSLIYSATGAPDHHIESIKARPGYVLVAANEILRHAT